MLFTINSRYIIKYLKSWISVSVTVKAKRMLQQRNWPDAPRNISLFWYINLIRLEISMEVCLH